jgi:hypothetical protein
MINRDESCINNALLPAKMSSKLNCHRCEQVIYEKDKFGPVNHNIYHKSCFKCFICDTALSLKSYATSQASINDKEVYCGSHAPKSKVSNSMSRIMLNPATGKNGVTQSSSKENLIINGVLSSSTIEKPYISRPPISSIERPTHFNTSNLFIKTRSEGKVSALTKKWNSIENLLSSQKSGSQSNLLSNSKVEDLRKNSKTSVADTPERNKPYTVKHSSETESPKNTIEITFSPATDQLTFKHAENQQFITEPSNVSPRLNRAKFIVDDQGGGISYSKYMEEIKGRHHNYTDPKRNVTDLYLKSPSTTRRTGSAGNIFDEVSSKTQTKTKKKSNIQVLINDELNFYETFNQASTNLSDNRLNRDKAATFSRFTGKNYDNEILEKMLSDNAEYSNGKSDETTRIIVGFQANGNNTNLNVEGGSFTRVRTLSRDSLNESSSKSGLNYSYSNQQVSTENLTQSRPEYYFEQKESKPIQERCLGKLMISYVYRNQEFVVTIHKAENLFKDKDDPLDTYVTMMMLPDPRNITTCTTIISENSVDPEWAQTFIFGISLATLQSKYIYLSIKDHKMASELLSAGLQYEALKLISLGEALISLSEVRENVYYEMWCNLKEPSDVQDIILTKDL